MEGGWGKLYFLYFSEFINHIEFILNPISFYFHLMQIWGPKMQNESKLATVGAS